MSGLQRSQEAWDDRMRRKQLYLSKLDSRPYSRHQYDRQVHSHMGSRPWKCITARKDAERAVWIELLDEIIKKYLLDTDICTIISTLAGYYVFPWKGYPF